jgi:predicted nucleic acid-binding protein
VAIIVDTGPLFALAHESDYYHDAIKKYLLKRRDTLLVPLPVVTETCIVLLDRLGPEAEFIFLRSIAKKELHVEQVSDSDFTRIAEILEQYREAEFGMVDAATMAIAERLKIDTVLTLDRRDFGIYRPRHCPAFHLVPEGLR